MTTTTNEENEPFLRSGSPSDRSHASKQPRDCSRWSPSTWYPRPRRDCLSRETRIIACVLCLQFLISFAKHIIEVPTIRLFEIAICNRYYHDHRVFQKPFLSIARIDEERCKIPQVQNDLASLVGWRFSFDALPVLLTALVYGRLADRVGRRPILALSFLGLLCNLMWVVFVCYANEILPVKLVWASSVFILLGGGQRVAKSILFVSVADIHGQPQRTRYMYMLASIPHLTTLIAPLFANLFMNIDIWIPFAIAGGALSIGFLLTWVMPESLDTLDLPPLQAGLADSTTSLLHASPRPSNEGQREAPASYPEAPEEQTSSKRSSNIFRDILALLKVPGVPFCLALFLLRPIALISRAFVYQHASETFHWPMSKTNWLRFSEAVGSSLVTLIFIPVLSSVLDRKDYSAKKLDLNIIRCSLFIAAIGFAILWRSTASWVMALGLLICGLGEGFEPSLKGLATSLIDGPYNARLLTLATVLEVIGKLIGGPLMARLFSIGRRQDHGSEGINFLTASLIFVVLTLAALAARLRR